MMNNPIPILMYHSIESMPKSTVMRSLHVPTKRFEMQMKLLDMFGYKGLSIRELTPYLEGKKIGKVIGITFDDGYQNNLLNAAPILKKYNFGATSYIVSKRIGESNIWDYEQGVTQRPLMNKSEIKNWLEYGLDIGAHTQTHPLLNDLSQKESHDEIFNCKQDLEKMFDLTIKDFCYPFGQFNEPLIEVVREIGYKTATTMIRGRVGLNENFLRLPRIPINHHTLMHVFFAKIFTRYEDKRRK